MAKCMAVCKLNRSQPFLDLHAMCACSAIRMLHGKTPPAELWNANDPDGLYGADCFLCGAMEKHADKPFDFPDKDGRSFPGNGKTLVGLSFDDYKFWIGNGKGPQPGNTVVGVIIKHPLGQCRKGKYALTSAEKGGANVNLGMFTLTLEAFARLLAASYERVVLRK